MAYACLKKRICVVGCRPSGLSVLYHFDKLTDDEIPEIVCYEKQSTWGGLWNLDWRTGMGIFLLVVYSKVCYLLTCFGTNSL